MSEEKRDHTLIIAERIEELQKLIGDWEDMDPQVRYATALKALSPKEENEG